MALEIKLGERIAQVKLLEEEGCRIKVMVDKKVYELDMRQVEKGVYSVMFENHSFNVELIENGTPKKYTVNTFYHSYEAEIIDAETRYLQARNTGSIEALESIVCSPMPGKVVKIPVGLNEEVKKGDTVIIVSAMKMESEYKAMKDGVVTKIFVNEGDTVDGDQHLLFIDEKS